MKMQNLEDLLHDQVRDLYDAEKQLVKALPKMAEAASSPELKKAFEDHLKQTQGHVTRLEEVFKHLNHSARAKTCEAMKGLVAEGEEIMSRQSRAGGPRCWSDRRRAEGGTLRDRRLWNAQHLGRSAFPDRDQASSGPDSARGKASRSVAHAARGAASQRAIGIAIIARQDGLTGKSTSRLDARSDERLRLRIKA